MIRSFLRLMFLIPAVTLSGYASAQNNFAERCEGSWKGTMYMYAKGKLTDSVTIVLTVMPDVEAAGTWSWKTVYLSEKMPVTKDYTLMQKNETEYILVEGDGVILTNYIFENKMYSLFKVDKTWLTASYELVSEQLVFEVTSGVVSNQKSKGVTNYTVDFLQRAVLTRVN